MKSVARRPLLLPAWLCALMLTACDGSGTAPGAGGPPPFEVDVVTLSAANTTLTQELPGRLQAWRTAEVRARIEGIVEKRLFKEGSDVRAGTALFRIDPRQYKASVDAANADVSLARLTVERYTQLLEMKAVSKQEFDQAVAKLKQAEATLAKAKIDYENTSVPAPISGRIGRALVTEGALVGKGEATQLATIEQVDPMYANFSQTTSELMRLQQAMQAGSLKKSDSISVELVLEDGTVYSRKGKLLFTDLAVDPGTGAVNLRAEFPNPKKELLPGMFARIRFPQAVAENAITVPQRAVQASSDGQYVLVVDAAGKVAQRAVKMNGMSGTDWIVSNGLKAGEMVIVNGLQKTRPGAVVKPVQWVPNGAATAAVPAATVPPVAAASEKAAEKPVAAPSPTPAAAATAAPAQAAAPATAPAPTAKKDN